MTLQDPVAIYNAESNMDAWQVQQFLESRGVPAFAAEDNSLAGYWVLGTMSEIHKPQVWVDRFDVERAAPLIAEYEQRKIDRDAQRKANELETILVPCEDCGQSSLFAGSLEGTTQECPNCGGYVDVGDLDWPVDDFGEPEDAGDGELE